MRKRQEFTTAVRVEIIKRATASNGVIYCELCHLPTKKFHIDHIDAEAMKIGKRIKLTTKDGQLLCAGSRETCHGRKTAEEDIPKIAKAKRVEAKHIGATVPSAKLMQSRGFTKSSKQINREANTKDKLPLPLRRDGYLGGFKIIDE